MGIKIDGVEIPLGVPGIGVPTGGETCQTLIKKSSTNYDTEWGVPDIPLATEEKKGTVKSSTGTDHVVVAQDGTMSVTDVSVAEHAASADMVMNKLTVGKISSVSDGFEYDGSEPETLLLENLAIPVSPASGISDYNSITKACIGNIRDGNNINNRPNSYVNYYESINYGSILNIAGPYNNSADQMQFLAGSSNNNALFFRTGYPLATNPRWNPWCQIITDLNSAINPNLLYNYNFKNPVNQTGVTSTIYDGYFFDGWYFRNHAGTTALSELTSDGWHVKWNLIEGTTADTSGGINQRLEFPSELFNKTVTFSIYITSNNSTGNFNAGVRRANSVRYHTNNVIGVTIPAGQTGLFTVTGVFPSDLGGYNGINIGFYTATNIDVTISAIKLEYGNRQTLCRRNSSGQWEICDVPDYSEQLAKCQRYFQNLNLYKFNNTNYGISIAQSSTISWGIIPLPVTLRALPTITYSGNIDLWNNVHNKVTSIRNDKIGLNGINLRLDSTNLIVGQTYIINSNSDVNSYIYLDARL